MSGASQGQLDGQGSAAGGACTPSLPLCVRGTTLAVQHPRPGTYTLLSPKAPTQVAHSEDEYVNLAVAAASDIPVRPATPDDIDEQ